MRNPGTWPGGLLLGIIGERLTSDPPENPVDVSPGQRRIAYATLAFVTILSGVSIAAEVELFPFSYFPMFSNIHDAREQISKLYIVGLVGDEQHEFTGKEVRSFTRTRVRDLYRYAKRLRKRDGLRSFAEKILVLQERWREKEGVDTPRLDGIQVYFYHWNLDARAENVATPDRRELLIEVRRHPRAG